MSPEQPVECHEKILVSASDIQTCQRPMDVARHPITQRVIGIWNYYRKKTDPSCEEVTLEQIQNDARLIGELKMFLFYGEGGNHVFPALAITGKLRHRIAETLNAYEYQLQENLPCVSGETFTDSFLPLSAYY